MKKTLLVCGRYPLPEDHGNPMRTMNFVRFFKKYGTVDIAYLLRESEGHEKQSFFTNEYALQINDLPGSFKKRMYRVIGGIPVPIFKYSRDSERLVFKLLEENDYDYIFIRYLHSTHWLFKVPTKYWSKAIIDVDDILSGSVYHSNFRSINGYYKKLLVWANRQLLIKYERKCFKLGVPILFCSENDRSRFAGNIDKSNAFVVPNIYENKSFENFDFGRGLNNDNILLFVGALDYGPNVHGLKWFIESVFPEFRKNYPDARLIVLGRSPDVEIKRLCERSEGVELYANAPDLKEYYKKCKVVIVPLLAGGGTRIKILEAALTDRPVLSTAAGVEGLDLNNETDLLFFENAPDFLEQYKKLCDRNKYNSLINSAKKKVLTKYSVENFNNAMERVLNELDNKKHTFCN